MLRDFLANDLDYVIFCAVSLTGWTAFYLGVRRGATGSRIAFAAFPLVTIMNLGGWFLVHAAGEHERNSRQALVEGLAPTYALMMEKMGHSRITLDTRPDDPSYLAMIEAEKDWLKANPEVNDIYTFKMNSTGQVRLMVDSETDYDRDGAYLGEREQRTPIGEKYDEVAAVELRRAFQGQKGFQGIPYTDRWGTWVSAYAPMFDENGRLDAVLGVDYNASAWMNAIHKARGTMIGMLFVIELVIVTSLAIIILLRNSLAEGNRVQVLLSAQQVELEKKVTERTEALLQAERQMLQQEKLASVGQLAAGIAHEINTPIQYVGDNLRALSDSFNDLQQILTRYRELVALVSKGADGPTDLESIQRLEKELDLDYLLDDSPKAIAQGLEGVGRIAHIVRAMKDFSHIDRGQTSEVDLNRAVEIALTVARNEYKHVADVERHLQPLPPVRCYAGEVNQVLLNLLVNAAHAVADTGRRGQISVTTRPDGDHVEIAIGDTGPGIPEEIRGKIFDPFFTTKDAGRGTGQGLALAQQIVVRRHNGSLTFESVLGRGTTFFIRLPLRGAGRDHERRADEPVAASIR